MPTRRAPISHSGSTSAAVSTRWAGTPTRCATSRNRLEFELVGLPITSTTSTCGAMIFTASWRFCVA
jgi:hypothetical protein